MEFAPHDLLFYSPHPAHSAEDVVLALRAELYTISGHEVDALNSSVALPHASEFSPAD
ncbi:hypothetical protein HRbin02_01412 [Candidatus Calditenuaceae archaeon HR02]|nr:hypothetical protein HRbin02_01412 [Candidatus Calditenuaceae archaeon HR02]